MDSIINSWTQGTRSLVAGESSDGARNVFRFRYGDSPQSNYYTISGLNVAATKSYDRIQIVNDSGAVSTVSESSWAGSWSGKTFSQGVADAFANPSGSGRPLATYSAVAFELTDGANAGYWVVVNDETAAFGDRDVVLRLTGGAVETYLGHSRSGRGLGVDELFVPSTTAGGTIIGHDASDWLTGGVAADTIEGGGGNDILQGGPGNDRLSGGLGDDTLTGGPGNDVFVGSVDELNGDRIADFATGDSIIVTGADLSALNGASVGSIVALGANKTLGVSAPSGAYRWSAAYAAGDTTLTLTDGGVSQAPSLSIRADVGGAFEGDTLSFAVSRSGDATGASSVNWVVASTGASPSDFNARGFPSGSLRFEAGETTKTITLSTARDDVSEGDEAFTVSLSGPTGAVIDVASANGVIFDRPYQPTIVPTPRFSAYAYAALNSDLYIAFGTDVSALTSHYINHGRAEGRYAAGFDPYAYAAANSDLFAVYGANVNALVEHYVSHGRAEGRRSANFDPYAYAAANSDLFAAFGANVAALVEHYVNHGRTEGRTAAGFDVEGYAAANSDLFNAFGTDAAALISHYVNHGRAEGRTATGFDAEGYAAGNSDLFNNFGTNASALLNHYVNFGRSEGRDAGVLATT